MNQAYELLEKNVLRHPDKTAIVWGDQHISFADVERDANRLAWVLRESGVKKGDVVAHSSPNRPELIAFNFAAWRLGCVVTAVNPLFKADEVVSVMNDSPVVALLASSGMATIVEERRARLPGLKSLLLLDEWDALLDKSSDDPCPIATCSPDDGCTRLYTSGTTGHLRGAMHTHESTVMTAQAMIQCQKVHRDSVCLVPMPLFYMFGNVCMIHVPMEVGATLILVERFTTGGDANDWLTQHQATWYGGSPTTYFRMLQEHDPDRHHYALETMMSGGSKMPPDLIAQCEEVFGGTVIETYGLTECPQVFSTHPDMVRKPGKVGYPQSNLQVRLVGADGNDAAAGAPGEIVVRGQSVCTGYWDRPEVNAEVFLDGGWMRTGDVAMRDDDGCYEIVDRLKDLIITGGANIYPIEVENVLYQHPAVAMCALVGIPDHEMGELAKAYVVLKPGAEASEEDLIAHCRDQLAHFKAPRSVEFRSELPLTPNGKIIKRQLRDEASTAIAGDHGEETP